MHEQWLSQTIEMAVENVKNGGGPFAAIVVRDGKIIGKGTNQVHVLHDPSAHAELLAIRQACETLQSIDLSDCVLYASGEPCPMCLGAAYWSTVGHIYYACGKQEVSEQTDFQNPLDRYFTDQKLPGDQRLVPFVQVTCKNALAPFYEWQKTTEQK
ncbi:nucleoside deaminase [Sporosarcina sp. Te-1]|nr:nucleoside deaminase [Sporosarcina sp. Te-1]